MNEQLITDLPRLEDEQLQDILRRDAEFTETIVLAIPMIATDPMFDLFSSDWIKRYWKKIAHEVHAGLTSDGILHWASEATVAALVAELSKHFHLSDAAMPACIALAVLIIRAAKKERSTAPR